VARHDQTRPVNRTDELERQVELLLAEIVTLKAKLARVTAQRADARRRLDLWRERHKSWQQERRELSER
jgi:predicted RNase H-like nuclease (RuvC/YqgF family)